MIAVALVATGLVLSRPSDQAVADGTPDIAIAVSTGETIYGNDIVVEVTASNDAGSDGYNLSFQDVLPLGVSYVPGSSSPEPQQIVRGDGTTALVWENVADLLDGTSVGISYAIRPDTAVYDAGDAIDTTPQVFVNSNPRNVPDFDADGDVVTGASSFTGSATGSSSTDLLAFLITKAEPSGEEELARGVHDHQTVYTITIENNTENPTTGFTVVDYLPAGLEFLGCGGVDNTTDPTGTGEEYPGAGAINPGNEPVMANPCLTPSSVTTVTTDPDGTGPLPNDVYTRVEWDGATLAAEFGSDDLAPSGSFTFDYIAAVPLLKNVQATLTDPTANLDNNTGARTGDEEDLTNYAAATGDYQSVLNPPSSVTSDTTFTVHAEEVLLRKSVSSDTVAQGQTSTWTLTIASSEYTTGTTAITVTDPLPDGLEFVSSTPLPDAGFPQAGPDGTQIVQWTLPAFSAPSASSTITMTTNTLTNYRDTGAPVAANDAWTNTATLSTDATLITDDAGATEVVTVTDTGSAGQSASGPSILKEVSVPGPGTLTCGDGSAVTWEPVLAGDYNPGDRVCWRLRVDFPTSVDTLTPIVQDFLPAGFAYDSWSAGANDDGIAAGSTLTDDTPVLTWDLGPDVDAGGLVFEAVVQTEIVDPTAAADGDILSNLMKYRFENSGEVVFQARDAADISWVEPQVNLSKGVIDVDDVLTNGGAQAPGTVTVENGDVVTYEVLLGNTGSVVALDVDVRDDLPPGIECADISSISDGGTCDVANSRIEWPNTLNLSVPAGGTLSLTYDLTVPDTTTALSTLVNPAGVRQYEGDTNNPGAARFVYVPADNIDPTQTPNTDAADDTATIRTPGPTIDKTRTTSISESGNAAANEATIGETITYTVTVDLPGGTTYYGPVEITDDLPTTLDLVTSSAPTLTRNGAAVGGAEGFTITTDAGADSVTVEFPLDGDSSYKTANGAAETFVLTFDALVLDNPATVRGGLIGNRADLDYRTEAGGNRNLNDNINVRIVEPNLALAKSNDDADGLVVSGQTITYTLDVTNPGDAAHTSTAHDLVLVDGPIPTELIVLDSGGDPAADGDPVDADGGTWNAATREITWNISSIAPDTTVSRSFQVQAEDPLVVSDQIVNTAAVTGTSLAGADPNERDNVPEFDGYHAEANDSVGVADIALTKAGTPGTRTVGEAITYTLDFTMPADTVAYDVTIIDDLPDGIVFDSFDSIACDQGGGACTPDISSVSVTDDGDVVSFFVGDIAAGSQARDVTITYTAIVDDDPAAVAGATLTNSATLHLNLTDQIAVDPVAPPDPGSFDRSGTPATDDTEIVEPSLSIDKDVTGQVGDTDTRRAKPGDALTFTIVVTNDTGATVSDAHDLTIEDTPDALLENYVFDAGSSTPGVTPSDTDPADGDISWTFAGPLAPGASITIVYTMDVVDPLDETTEVDLGPEATNTADVPSYFGVSTADRAAEPGRSYREHDDVTPDTVELELDLASIGDYVWHDIDGDGVQDPGEPPIANVDVVVTYLGPDDTFGTPDDEAVTVQTDASGLYLVDDLPAGDYRVDVVETDPDFVAGLFPSYDLDGGDDGVWNDSLGESEAKRDVDFGYTGAGSIGDTIFLDLDGDGVQDPGEGGIDGVDVVVTWFGPDGVAGGGDDIVYPTATTDDSGNYLVDLLPAGNFSVEVQAASLPVGSVLVTDPQGAVDGTALVTLGTGADDLDQDFGYQGAGSVGDTVYLDQDGDGVQGPGEPGLQNVTVQIDFAGADGIVGTGDDSTVVTTTDANGNYLFENLPPGDYTVSVTGGLPANVTNSDDPDGGADSTADLTLANGGNDLDQDFGYDADSVLGDRVWWDLNGDGVQDPGEPGINGVTVRAVGPNGLTLTTTTSGDGDYLFADIPDGDWTVTVTGGVPAGYAPTFDADGGADETSDVTLTTSDLDQDFGYAGDSSIGDRLWLDRDGDGVQDVDEPGLDGITVTLTWFGPGGVAGGGDDVVLTTVTDAFGNYSFPGLPAGEYLVEIDELDPDFPTGVAPTYDRDGTTATPDGSTPVTLPAATDLDVVDFGYRGGGSIGDTVWFDRDADATQDADEPGLSGIDVTLVWYGADNILGTADDETFTDVTDTDGAYGYTGLPAGNYDVTLDDADLPTGMVPTYDADGGDDHTSSLLLPDGGVNLDQDFGYHGDASIGDTVWLDQNGDGIQDPGEPGIAGQTVTVSWDGPDGPVEFTTTTDTDGNWIVDGLPDGDYTVTVDGGIADGAANTGDPDGGNDATADTTIAGGADDLDQDFGFQGLNTIGDRIWWDLDADGVQDAGEPGLDGVEVTITWFGVDGVAGGGDDLVFVTTTDPDGNYLVEHLPDGSFSVAVTDGLVPGRDTPTFDEDDGTVSPDLVTVVADLGVGDANPVEHLTADFGVSGTGTIGDTIWLDLDADETLDDGEPGIPAVEVTLTWEGADGTLGTADDVVLGTVETDADGSYLFEHLPAGDFRVDVAGVPATLSPTADPDGGDDASSVTTLAVGGSDLDQDFGYVGDAGVGDLVWLDVDGDGLADPNEPGIPGVTVTVTSPGVDGVIGTADDITIDVETGADGNYQAVGLPGVPTVVSYDDGDLTGGLTPDSDRDGGDATTTDVELETGDDVDDVDFAVVGDATLSGVVFDDRDGDGVLDPGEGPIPNVEIVIVWDGPDGPVTLVTTTDDDGEWSYPSVPAGDYEVTMTVETLRGGDVATTPVTISVTVPPGGTGTVEHGATPGASVGDLAWVDGNRNGVQDAGEPGLAGVTVRLLDDDGAVVATTTTDASGNYLFDDVAPGAYTVVVDLTTVPANFAPVSDPDGTLDGRSTVQLDAGEDDRAQDFGFSTTATSTPTTGTDPYRSAAIAGLLTIAGVGFWLASRRNRPAADGR